MTLYLKTRFRGVVKRGEDAEEFLVGRSPSPTPETPGIQHMKVFSFATKKSGHVRSGQVRSGQGRSGQIRAISS